MHAHPQIKRPTAVSTAVLAWKSRSPGFAKPTAQHHQRQLRPSRSIRGVEANLGGGLSFPQQVAGAVRALRQPGRLAGICGNERTGTNSVTLVIY